MNNPREGLTASARLLDPRFEYTPAAQTNIAATWKRFGFDPRTNEQRRRRMLGRPAESGPSAFNSAAWTALAAGNG